MQETRIFLDIMKYENGDIDFYVGGGSCDGEFHSSLSSAIEDLTERADVESYLM